MARYRNDYDDREFRGRSDRFDRERPWNFNQPYENRQSFDNYGEAAYGRGRFGERADYQYDEPRYGDSARRYGQEDYRRSPYEGRDPDWRGSTYERSSRSRLRIRDIMTRDLAVAGRDTTLREVATMMRDEDTGVIPVVDYAADGTDKAPAQDRRGGNGYGYGKVIGLITDRDIVVRAVADGKDCTATRAEEIMSSDVHTARPHDRVVEVIRKMGDKQVRRIPVVNEGGRLLGMVSLGDIAVETEADRELAEALEDISKEGSFWNKVFG